MLENIKPTSFTELQNIARGELVELPPFSPTQPFYARMCKPSLMSMFYSGKVPNVLLEEVRKVFRQEHGELIPDVESINSESTSNMMQVIDLLASAAFIEPTWDEIKQSGVQLTEAQYLFIFNYTQGDVQNLTNFREQ